MQLITAATYMHGTAVVATGNMDMGSGYSEGLQSDTSSTR